jgi:hypothetical protein
VADAEPILPRREMSIRERFRSPDSYGLLLVLIIASIVATAGISETDVGKVLTPILLGGTLLFALWTSRVGPRIRRIAWVVVPLLVVATVFTGIASGGDAGHAVVAWMSAILVLAALIAILGRLAEHTTISFQTVLGALSMYLLLGLLYAAVFSGFAAMSGDPFFAQGANAGTSVNYVYFSYVTISTVGYGDLSAEQSFGKMLAASEALLGQLFLVTVVALLVSNLGKARRGRGSRTGERAGSEGSTAD